MSDVSMKIIARVKSDFPEKFGIPQQSGLVKELKSQVVFEPQFRVPEAVRGLEAFSHIWLLWQFSQSVREDWSPTVRPPRLGGNARMGVFATRSPFRPNSIGLSAVKLEKVELEGKDGPVLHISGADIMDGTPVFDIKPYLPYADAYPDAVGGFADKVERKVLQVDFPAELLERVPEELRNGLIAVLAQDPRPAYQNAADRVYTMSFAGLEVSFRAEEGKVVVVAVKI